MTGRYFQAPVLRSEAERNAALFRFWGRWWVPVIFIAVGIALVSFPAVYAGRGLDPSAYRVPVIAAILTPPLLVLFGLAVGNRLQGIRLRVASLMGFAVLGSAMLRFLFGEDYVEAMPIKVFIGGFGGLLIFFALAAYTRMWLVRRSRMK